MALYFAEERLLTVYATIPMLGPGLDSAALSALQGIHMSSRQSHLSRTRGAAVLLIVGAVSMLLSLTVAAPSLAADDDALVSVSTSGGESNGESRTTYLSNNGRWVWFESSATNLVSAPAQSTFLAVFVRDMSRGVTTRVEIDGVPASSLFGISRNGAYGIVQVSDTEQLYRYEIATGATQRLPNGVCGTTPYGVGSVSDDGAVLFGGCGFLVQSGEWTHVKCPAGSGQTNAQPRSTVSLDAAGRTVLFSAECGNAQPRAYSMDVASGITTEVYNGRCSWISGNICVNWVKQTADGAHYGAIVQGSESHDIPAKLVLDGTPVPLPAGNDQAGLCGLTRDGSRAVVSAEAGIWSWSRITQDWSPVPTTYRPASCSSMTEDGTLAYTSGGQAYVTVEGAPPPPPPPPVETKTYIAMGDSYSSGEGNPPFDAGTATSTNTCHRSSAAWPRQLHRQRTDIVMLAHVACSGATRQAITSSFKTEPAQIAQLEALPEPDLITITLGGNDVGFADTLKNCYLVDCWQLGYIGYSQSRINDYLPRWLRKVYGGIAEARPDAHVVVVGYPRLFPVLQSSTVNCGWLTRTERRKLNNLAVLLDATTRKAAYDAGFDYVSTLNALDGHELCSSDSWVVPIRTTLINKQLFAHPTVLGQQAMADIVDGGISH